MPAKGKVRGRKPKAPSVSDEKLSLMDIAEEIGDPTIFEGVLAYKNLQKKYIDKPKEKEMTLQEFEAEVEKFKKEKIYKTTETLKIDENQQTTTTINSTTLDTQDGQGDT